VNGLMIILGAWKFDKDRMMKQGETEVGSWRGILVSEHLSEIRQSDKLVAENLGFGFDGYRSSRSIIGE
jgi:hypothetical protein